MFRSIPAPATACSRAGPPGYQMSSQTLTPTTGAVQLHDRGAGAHTEVAVLVEDAVVRQIALVIAMQDLAAGDYSAGVVEIRPQVHEAYRCNYTFGDLLCELV